MINFVYKRTFKQNKKTFKTKLLTLNILKTTTTFNKNINFMKLHYHNYKSYEIL